MYLTVSTLAPFLSHIHCPFFYLCYHIFVFYINTKMTKFVTGV